MHGTKDGVLRALAVTGGVITSAGLVLAATFGALAVLPLVLLSELAFLVGFGVLLDTFVVRSLLVPAAVHLIGDKVWWPSTLAKGPARARARELDRARADADHRQVATSTADGGATARWSLSEPARMPLQPGRGLGERRVAGHRRHRLVLPAVGPRVGAEEADVVAHPVQRGQRLPHPAVGDVALAVEGERVDAEPLAGGPRLDAGQRDAADGELAAAAPAARRCGRRRRRPATSCRCPSARAAPRAG